MTQHAMLVVWGLYAQEMGLIEKIESVPIKQKTRRHKPQRKVLEFLVAMLAGLPHLKDISHAAHPLDKDKAVAEAWGQTSWADYSGVSRTLQALREKEVSEMCAALDQVEQGLLRQEVERAISEGKLVLDGDLTGRPVCSTSSSYPDTAFGYMGDTIALGYQAALVSMHSPRYGRLWLSNQLHPGDTVSATQVQVMVRSAEARLGVRPHRRTDLLHRRVLRASEAQAQKAEHLHDSEVKLEAAKQKQAHFEQELHKWEAEVVCFSSEYAQTGREATTHCKLSRAKHKVNSLTKRMPRLQKQVEVATRRYQRHARDLADGDASLAQMRSRLQQFAQDNLENAKPIQIVLRLDAGFASRDNIAWLIEMGYDIYTKSRSTSVRQKLQDQLLPDQALQSVGRNANMYGWSSTTVNDYFTYPVNLALARYTLGERCKHAVFLHYGRDSVADDLDCWFHTYNARQTIEAGIKEGKSVFQMHHLKVRSPFALLLQERFACFAANFVRYAAHWLVQQQPKPSPIETGSVKHLVQVAAHTSAWVIRDGDNWLLTFTDHSLYAGHSLCFSPRPIQMCLPFF